MKNFLFLSAFLLSAVLLSIQSATAQGCFGYTNNTQNATCNGLCNGSATANAGFTRPQPITYLWSNGATTQTASNLCAGTYTVAVKDGNNCTSNHSVTITQPSAINSTISQTNVTCHGGTNGSATITVTSSGTYTYSWNTTPAQTTQTATGLAAGTYTVTATRTSTGCTTSRTITITQPAAITGSITSTPATCGQSDGTATASATGGTGTITYSWNTTPTQTTATATGLAPGVYTATAKDANNCSISGSVVVYNSGGPALSSLVTPNNCPGQSNASVTITPTGTNPPYQYVWSTSPSQTTQTATGLQAGEYTVMVTDNLNCASTLTIEVTDPDSIEIDITVNNVLCTGTLTGSAFAVASGGEGPYTYLWDNFPVSHDQTALGLGAGLYSVIVTDDNGCTAFKEITLTEPEPLYVSVSSTSASCNGSPDGTATANVHGATPGYSYAWGTSPVQTTVVATGLTGGSYNLTVTDTNGCSVFTTFGVNQPAAIGVSTSSTSSACGQPTGSATVTATGGGGNFTYLWNTSPVQTTATASGLSAGSYTVTVTDDEDCSVTATVTVQNQGGMTSSASHTNVSCNGGNNGTATATPNGGTPAYTYSWNTTPVQTTQTIFGLTAGTYSVTITDQAGCVSTASTTVTQPTAVTVVVNHTDITCLGSSNGTASAVAANGVTPYTYSWNTTPAQTTQTISGLGTGSYSVIITDGQGCTTSGSTTIVEPASALTASAVHTNIYCAGGNNGSATISASGGVTPYTYSWNTTPVQTTQTAIGLSAGTYIGTVTDSAGCSVTATTTVNSPQTFTIALSSTQTSCNVADGTAAVAPTGGTPGYTYVWNTSPAQHTDTATGLASGVYNVIVTDANGCTQSGSVTVSNQGGLSVEINSSEISCHGGTDGTATISVSGGSAPYSYSWDTNPVQTTASVSGLTASTYTATITDQAGCVFTESTVIDEPDAIAINPTVQDIQCLGDQNGAISVDVSGGSGPYEYLWDTSPSQSTDSIGGLEEGDYKVIVTDDNGCMDSLTVAISEPASALSANMIHSNTSCYGGSNGAATANTFGGTPTYTYSWNTSPVQVTQTAIGLSEGSYSVVITDAHGCSITESVTITEPAEITVQLFTDNPSCGQADGSAQAVGTGGTGSLVYSWNTSPVQTTATASGLDAGTYIVTVTDANGCAVPSTLTLNNENGPTLQTVSSDISCFGMANGTATVNPTGGTTPYTISWNTNPAQSTNTVFNLAPGTYTVTVTDGNGCQSFSTETITQPAAALTATTAGTDPSCSTCPDGSVTATVTGGTPAYTYSWNTSPVQTTATATGLVNGTYTVTVTDFNGCTTTSSVTLNSIITGIVHAATETSFTVYPNPTSGIITVEYETSQLTRLTLNITNMLGEQVMNSQSEVNGLFRQSVDLSDLAAGVYFIVLRSDNEMLMRKVLKK